MWLQDLDEGVKAADAAAKSVETPGRPLGEKSDLHDSGIVTSRESVSSAKSHKSGKGILGRWFGKSNKVSTSPTADRIERK